MLVAVDRLTIPTIPGAKRPARVVSPSQVADLFERIIQWQQWTGDIADLPAGSS